jgi:CheY-like chemotaxis protein
VRKGDEVGNYSGAVLSRRPEISILVVNDVMNSLTVLARLLPSVGFPTVEVANTADHAMRLAVVTQFRLVISEIALADGNGIDLIPRLRLTNVFHPMRGMIATSRCDKVHVEAAKAARIDAYMVKPFSLYSLRQHIDQALAKEDDVVVE